MKKEIFPWVEVKPTKTLKEIEKYFRWFLVQVKTVDFAFEINWPLVLKYLVKAQFSRFSHYCQLAQGHLGLLTWKPRTFTFFPSYANATVWSMNILSRKIDKEQKEVKALPFFVFIFYLHTNCNTPITLVYLQKLRIR